MDLFWKEFPEINRKVAFQYNFKASEGSLGCHCGTITGVFASFASSYSAANGGKNIEIMDTSKDGPIRYTRDSYGGYYVAPPAEMILVTKHLIDLKLTFADIGAGAYESIVEKCKRIPLWMMSDVINAEAPARRTASMPLTTFEMFGSTSQFAKYLIDTKCGFVMASPIVQNPSHRQGSNYSLNQGWFWIPPQHLSRSVNVARSHGRELFPPRKKWLAQVGSDLGIDHQKDILKAVFNTGRFPKEARFQPVQRARAKVAEA
jgi:hypothetical protein